jgi:peptide/nickel transport system substrate-binding protein
MVGWRSARDHEITRRPRRVRPARRKLHVGWIAGLGLCLAAGLGPLGCAASQQSPATRLPVTLVIGMPQSRQVDLSRGFQSLLSGWSTERLTFFDQHARPVPRLVERWSSSVDGLIWTLTVRKGVFFHDGTPLTNVDVARTIHDAATAPHVMASSVCLPDISHVSAEGDHDVVVRLTRRCYYLLDDLRVQVTRPGPIVPGQNETDIGTGPFSVVSSTPDEVTLAANTRYYLGAPTIDRIVARPYDTLRTAWADMMRGDVDFLWDVGPDTAEFLSDQVGIETRSFQGFASDAIVLNASRPPLRDPATRRALTLAIDRQELVRQGLKGHGATADAPVWPASWAFDGNAPGVPFDPSRTREFLASRTKAPITFTCLLPQSFALWERLALLVQRQLRAVGVEMRLEVLPTQALVARVGRGDFDAVMINPLGGPYASVHYLFWHSRGAWNQWGYRNADVDAALEAMRDAPDETHFKGAMSRFTMAIRDDPPALFLVWPNTLQAVSRRFELPDTASGRDALHVVAQWRARTAGGR